MSDARDFVDRLVAATNSHDVDAVAECFAADYENWTPVHPARGFAGREQVRRNWTTIFAAVPDITAAVTAIAVDEATAWTEWEMSGTRRDGSPHLMRGVVIFGTAGGRATWARFYLEPVDNSSGDVNAAVRAQAGEPR